MKKFYTIASALMLAMSMTMMTACSSENDPVIDEPVVPEQPTTRIVTLKATADMGAETRVAVEGIDGKDDAFRITGWKDGDEVKVFAFAYNEEYPWESYEEIAFAYDASKDVFTGEVPSNIELSDLKYAYIGGSVGDVMPDPYGNFDIMNINIPIAITNPEDCFLFGNVSVDDESISANLSAPYALACVHNNTAIDIVVGQIAQTNMYCWNGLSYEYNSYKSSFTLGSGYTSVVDNAEKFTVPANEKVYFVIPPKNVSGNVWYGLYDFTNQKVIAAPKENVTLGTVYKVQVNPSTTGTQMTNIYDVYYGIKWVQLWAGGPKFAECNVGFTSLTAEDYGGYYTWGGSYKNGDGITWNGAHNTTNTGSGNLASTDDTATKLWGNAWRMPTEAELNTLTNEDHSDKCESEWTDNYKGTGVSGRIFKGKGDYASNSIFLPAAGECDVDNIGDLVGGQGNYGYYWSSTPADSDYACYQGFGSGGQCVSYNYRNVGYSVRAVLAE